MMIPLIDGHLDLAPSAVRTDRDITLEIDDLRKRENLLGRHEWGTPSVCLPEMRKANMYVCMPSLYTRSRQPEDPLQVKSRGERDYSDRSLAYTEGWAQLAYYRLLHMQGQMRIIRTQGELQTHWQACVESQNPGGIVVPGQPIEKQPIGAVIMMEGCDAIVDPQQGRLWFEEGVRIAALVHSGYNGYATGNNEEGPLSADGRELLKVFAEVGMIVDVSHLCDLSFYEVLEQFPGRIAATHSNCRKFVTGNRLLTDEQIRMIIERQGVIGAVCYNRFLAEHWKTDNTRKDSVSLSAMADHIDHICQLAGDAQHAAIGSDLDGGFGVECIPAEVDTIADLQKLAPILSDRGYADSDIAAIFYKNWLRFLGETLPQ